MAERQGRRTREQTRLLLLETARNVMLDEGLPEGTNLKLTSVLERAGLTTGAAYQVWKSQQMFQEDFALFVAREYEWARPPIDPAVLLAEIKSTPNLDEAVAVISRVYFDAFVNRPQFLMVLHYWGVQAPTPELTEAVQTGYEIVHADLAAACAGMLDHHGFICRDPHTVDAMAIAIAATTEGMILRRHFDADRVRSASDTTHDGQAIHASIVRAIVGSYTEPVA